MLNSLKCTNLYSKMELAIWNTEDKVKSTAKAVTDKDNIKKVAKTACAVATISSAAGTGALVGTMITKGVTKQLATATAIQATKMAAFRAGYKTLKDEK